MTAERTPTTPDRWEQAEFSLPEVKREGPKPEIEFKTEDGYRWFAYQFPYGVRQICLEDLETRAVVTTLVYNTETRVAAHKAWAGARQSRAPGTPWEIVSEMGQKGVDPDEKLEQTFVGYGHASVGDMARMTIDFANIPMHWCAGLFGEGQTNDGQEKSTRYQSQFGGAILHGLRFYLPESVPADTVEALEEKYQAFGRRSLELFAKHQQSLTEAFDAFYQPKGVKERSSRSSRVLDCARFFLLFGQGSGMSFGTSARDWSRIIGEMRASPLDFYRRMSYQLERLLTPTPREEWLLQYKAEAPSLIKHTEAARTVNNNVAALREYVLKLGILDHVTVQTKFQVSVKQGVQRIAPVFTEADRMVAEYLLLIWPGLDSNWLLPWVGNNPPQVKKEISNIIFVNHTQHKELPVFARTSRIGLVFDCSLGEMRDFNRQRAWGRFLSIPLVYGGVIDKSTAQQIISKGFVLPAYLTEIPEFAQARYEFSSDMESYYRDLISFVEEVEAKGITDFSFIINLLPLAHRVEFWMHGDPKQADYMTKLRVRPGGHINYRLLAFKANQLIADSDLYLSGMRIGKQPDPASREEFFDRS